MYFIVFKKYHNIAFSRRLKSATDTGEFTRHGYKYRLQFIMTSAKPCIKREKRNSEYVGTMKWDHYSGG